MPREADVVNCWCHKMSFLSGLNQIDSLENGSKVMLGQTERSLQLMLTAQLSIFVHFAMMFLSSET